MENKVLPCIVCDKPLKPIETDIMNIPDDSNVFRTYGQYGSTVFDPMDGTFLEINICDECVKKKKDSILVGKRSRQISYEYIEFKTHGAP